MLMPKKMQHTKYGKATQLDCLKHLTAVFNPTPSHLLVPNTLFSFFCNYGHALYKRAYWFLKNLRQRILYYPSAGKDTLALHPCFPTLGKYRAVCSKLSQLWESVSQCAGRFPNFGKASRSVQEGFPTLGKCRAACRKLSQNTLLILYKTTHLYTPHYHKNNILSII